MTIAGYNLQGDLDLCTRETDQIKFAETAKKLAVQRNVSERTVMLWCYLRSPDRDTAERIKSWIQEFDRSRKWLMSLPKYEIAD